MEYKILEHADNIEILSPNGERVLQISRTYTWYGKRKTKVFKDNSLIFEVHTYPIVFSEQITYQKLEDELILVNGSFLLGHTGKIITLKSPSLLSRHYSLYRNERLIGTVDSEKRGVSLPPIQYKAVFDKAEIENIYGLILFSMRLTTFD